MMWDGEQRTVAAGSVTAQAAGRRAENTSALPIPCDFFGGVCMDRAKLKRAVQETHEALYQAGSQSAHRVAETAYHRALYALANHHCTPVGDEDERSREARSETSVASASDTPTGIAEIEKLITRVCELYHRSRHAADVAEEYRDARLVLRTRIVMLMAATGRRSLLEHLEANERGSR